MNKLLLIFLISGFLRAAASVIMLPKIKEVRKTEKFYSIRAIKNFIQFNFKV